MTESWRRHFLEEANPCPSPRQITALHNRTSPRVFPLNSESRAEDGVRLFTSNQTSEKESAAEMDTTDQVSPKKLDQDPDICVFHLLYLAPLLLIGGRNYENEPFS